MPNCPALLRSAMKQLSSAGMSQNSVGTAA